MGREERIAAGPLEAARGWSPEGSRTERSHGAERGRPRAEGGCVDRVCGERRGPTRASVSMAGRLFGRQRRATVNGSRGSVMGLNESRNCRHSNRHSETLLGDEVYRSHPFHDPGPPPWRTLPLAVSDGPDRNHRGLIRWTRYSTLIPTDSRIQPPPWKLPQRHQPQAPALAAAIVP